MSGSATIMLAPASIWWRPRSAWPGSVPVIACRPALPLALGWIVLQALSLWPHGAWMTRRMADGSDDPLGLLALAAAIALVVRVSSRLRLTPSLPWLAAAALGTLGANAALFVAPPLVASLLAALALAAGIVAWWPRGEARLPLGLLLVLALPLVASLQYYAGYPLRWITAWLSAWLLQLAGFDALASGAAMTVAGRLVIVDAPCSGVQLAWFGWFCAAVGASIVPLPERSFAARLPWVGVIVLGANVVRNSVLVALEARPQGLDAAWHEAIGAGALAAACAAVLAVMAQRGAR